MPTPVNDIIIGAHHKIVLRINRRRSHRFSVIHISSHSICSITHSTGKENSPWPESTIPCINLVRKGTRMKKRIVSKFIHHFKSTISELQGRFEQLPRPDHYSPMPNATFLRAIAVKDNVSSTVEFRVRPVAASWRYQMYVIVDKEYVYWWDESMRLQNFWGVTLYQPSGMQNMSHVIAMFDSGVGVEVKAKNGRMSVHVYAPYTFLVSHRQIVNWLNFKQFFLSTLFRIVQKDC